MSRGSGSLLSRGRAREQVEAVRLVGRAGACAIAALILCGSRLLLADGGMTIVALGDSTTAGTPGFQSPVEAPPDGRGDPQSQYAYWMTQRHPEWRVLNRGVAGERTDEILRRFARDVAAAHPQVVIVLAGVNDLYQGEPAPPIIERLERLYAQAAQQQMTVVACTILPYRGMSEGRRAAMAQVNAWIRDYSASHGLLCCDLFSVVRDPASPWQLIGSPDGLHPDVAGYRAMGEALTGVIERWMAAAHPPESAP